MGDKGKGKDSGQTKKPKAQKVGHRPHEERERQGALTQAPIGEAGKSAAKRD